MPQTFDPAVTERAVRMMLAQLPEHWSIDNADAAVGASPGAGLYPTMAPVGQRCQGSRWALWWVVLFLLRQWLGSLYAPLARGAGSRSPRSGPGVPHPCRVGHFRDVEVVSFACSISSAITSTTTCRGSLVSGAVRCAAAVRGAEQVRLLCEVIGRVGIEVKQLQRTAHVSVHAIPVDGPRFCRAVGLDRGEFFVAETLRIRRAAGTRSWPEQDVHDVLRLLCCGPSRDCSPGRRDHGRAGDRRAPALMPTSVAASGPRPWPDGSPGRLRGGGRADGWEGRPW